MVYGYGGYNEIDRRLVTTSINSLESGIGESNHLTTRILIKIYPLYYRSRGWTKRKCSFNCRGNRFDFRSSDKDAWKCKLNKFQI